MSPADRNNPPSVLARGISVLSAFSANRPTMTLSEISRATGLPKSTAHRMCEELVALHCLSHAERGYQLGIKLFELGELVPMRRNLRELALPYMEDLRTATNATIHLAVLDGTEVVYVMILEQDKAVPALPSRSGGRLPAHATGVGKALLAFSDESAAQACIEAGLVQLTRNTITNPDVLLRELKRVRQNGIAVDNQESVVGIACVAAPILGHDGHPIGAMSVSCANTRMSVRAAQAVRTAALGLSRELSRPRARTFSRAWRPAQPNPSSPAPGSNAAPVGASAGQATSVSR